MKRFSITVYSSLLIIFSFSCGKKDNLVTEQGINIVTTYHYNIALSEKRLSPHNFTIDLDTVIVRAKNDTWQYSVLEITTNKPEQFEAKIKGGPINNLGHFRGGDNQEYKIKIQDGIVTTTRLRNNAKWFDVTEEMKPSFEKMLEDQGLIFHKSI